MITFGLFKRNKMYDRLNKLLKYCQYLDIEKLDRISECTNDICSITFYFNSNLGPVQIELITLNGLALSYANYAGVNVFKISCGTDWLEVQPNLNENTITPEQIDLAIYELEQYFQQCYGDIDEILRQRKLQEKKELTIHNKLLQYFKTL